MIRWKLLAFWATLFYLVYCWPTEGKIKPVTIDVYPRAVANRGTIRVRWRIERHIDNRWQSLAWGSAEGESGSSIWSMNGENEPVVFWRFLQLPTGEYLFEACVYRFTAGKWLRFCASQEAIVQ